MIPFISGKKLFGLLLVLIVLCIISIYLYGIYIGFELVFHEVYEPRQVSLSGYKFTSGSKNIYDTTKVILLDTPTPWEGVYSSVNYYVFQPGDSMFKQNNCPNKNCFVTSNKHLASKADAVLYHLMQLPKTFPKTRPSNQVWIVYIMEAPWLVQVNWTSLNGVFNWTMSYREDSDVVVKYGLIAKKLIEESTNFKNINKIPFHEKKSVVWLVSHCNTTSKREEYVRELQKHIDVDVYGKCGTKICFPSQSSICYEKILQRYKFYLSFENSLCNDYITEKFFNVLQYDVVPVVYGVNDYEKHGPPGGYVNAMHFPDPKNLAAHLKEIATNETKYNKYLEWKSSHGSFLYPWMCYLCDKLHSHIVPTVKTDLKKWWVDDAQCRTWDRKKGFT